MVGWIWLVFLPAKSLVMVNIIQNSSHLLYCYTCSCGTIALCILQFHYLLGVLHHWSLFLWRLDQRPLQFPGVQCVPQHGGVLWLPPLALVPHTGLPCGPGGTNIPLPAGCPQGCGPCAAGGHLLDHWDLQVGVNTLRLRQNGCHFPDDIFKCILLIEN